MTAETLRNKLAFIPHDERERCVKNMERFSDLAWEITFRVAEDDFNDPMFNKETHVWAGPPWLEEAPDPAPDTFISVWPCHWDRFIMVQDRGARVSLTYRKSMMVPADMEELYGDSPYMDWGLFSNADEAMRAYQDKSIWDARAGSWRRHLENEAIWKTRVSEAIDAAGVPPTVILLDPDKDAEHALTLFGSFADFANWAIDDDGTMLSKVSRDIAEAAGRVLVYLRPLNLIWAVTVGASEDEPETKVLNENGSDIPF